MREIIIPAQNIHTHTKYKCCEAKTLAIT